MPADTLVISPTYNEKDNVLLLADGVFRHLPEANLLIVDDNSPDGTGQVADELAARDPRVKVMHRAGKQGLGRAYLAAFAHALPLGYRRIVTMDCDLSHPAEALPGLVSALDRQDLAVGSRYAGGVRVVNWPLSRLILSKSAALYARILTGMPVQDPTSGFMAYRREVLENIDLASIESSGYSFLIEMKHAAWSRGFAVAEYPITFVERANGVSKMNAAIVTEALRVVGKLVMKKGFKRKAPATAHPCSVSASRGRA
jgi:dolichol-phosphate mannosyltransferase